MTQKVKLPNSPTVKSSSQPSLFGPPPLLQGEDTEAYHEFHARTTGALKPSDIFEEIWVRDFVDLAWEIYRLRRLKTNLLTANRHKGLKEILDTIYCSIASWELAQNWAKRQDDAIEEVDNLLAGAGLTMDAVMAQTLSVMIENVERIDRMIMNAEMRRNAVLHEVELHRKTLGQALRRVNGEVEDGEFEEIEAPQITDRKAA